MTGERPSAPDRLYGFLPRLVSFALAVGMTGLILARPTLFAQGEEVHHVPLLAVMWGLAAGYVHGVGFVPWNPVLKVVLGPGPAWVLLIGGLFWALTGSGPAS